ncbi:hypothetical protein [Hutsoniella sourekii]|nr:hypothetical protein [Hutsoniella sourekii]
MTTHIHPAILDGMQEQLPSPYQLKSKNTQPASSSQSGVQDLSD